MTSLADVRKQYPEFKDRSDKDLATAMHNIYQSNSGQKIPFDQFSHAIGYVPSLETSDPRSAPKYNMQSTLGGYTSPPTPPVPNTSPTQPLSVTEPVKRASWEDTLKSPGKSWPDIAKSMVGSVLYQYGEQSRRELKNLQYVDGQFKLGELADYAKIGEGMYTNAQKGIQAKRPNDMSFMQELTYDTQMMLMRMAPVVAGGLASGGNSIVALAPMFAQVRAERYTAMRQAGHDHKKAMLHADVAALIEVGTEQIPIGWMMKRGTPFVKRIIQGTIGEGFQESVSAALQAGWDKGTINPDMTWQEALNAVGYEGLIGTLGGATMSAAFHPFFKDMQDVAKNTPNYPQWKPGKPEVGKLWPDMVTMGEQDWLTKPPPPTPPTAPAELSEPTKAVMRDIRETSDRFLRSSQQKTPRDGAVPVGSAHISDLQEGEALRVFLDEVGKGSTPDVALAAGKDVAKKVADNWNNRSSDPYTKVNPGAADTTLENAWRRVLNADKPAKKTKQERIDQEYKEVGGVKPAQVFNTFAGNGKLNNLTGQRVTVDQIASAIPGKNHKEKVRGVNTAIDYWEKVENSPYGDRWHPTFIRHKDGTVEFLTQNSESSKKWARDNIPFKATHMEIAPGVDWKYEHTPVMVDEARDSSGYIEETGEIHSMMPGADLIPISEWKTPPKEYQSVDYTEVMQKQITGVPVLKSTMTRVRKEYEAIKDMPQFERHADLLDGVLTWNERHPAEEKPAPVKKKAKKKAVKVDDKKLQSQIASLRKVADNMDKAIQDKYADRLANTPKRVAQAQTARNEGDRLTRTQQALRKLADLRETGQVPDILADLKSKKAVYELMAAEMIPVPNGYHAYHTDSGKPRADASEKSLALWALVEGKSEADTQRDRTRTLEQQLVGTKIPGFFPTPPQVAQHLVDLAEIEPGMSVLEPSAGAGHIADVIREAQPNAQIRTNEISYTLNQILEAKGYETTQDDFLEMTEQFDRIVMNPPFEKGQDVQHLQHAYDLLRPGGRVVSIVGEHPFFGSEKRSKDFRDWIDDKNALVEDLESGVFDDPSLVRTTGVKSRIVVMEKPTVEEVPTRLSRGGAAGGMGPVSPGDVLGAQPQTQVAGTNLEPFLDKLNSAQDAKDAMARIIKMFEGSTEIARRGVIPWKETERMAHDYGFDHIVKRRVGEAWNPEQYEAARVFLDAAIEEVTQDAIIANATQSNEDLATFQNHLDKFVLAAQQTLGARAEWGRVGRIMQKQTMSSEYLTKVLDTMGDKDTIAAKAKVLTDLKAQGLNPQQMGKRATQLQTATTMEKILEVWKAGLLTGLTTQVVNIGSNALNTGLNIPETATAALWGKTHGGDKVYFRETTARVYGLVHGMMAGARYGWEAFKTGQPVFDTETKVNEVSGRMRGAIGTDPDSTMFAKHVGWTVRLSFRALTAGDEFFKAVARDMELRSQAMRQAIKEGNGKRRAQDITIKVTDLYGKSKPKTFFSAEEKLMWKIHDDVLDFSKYMTFQTELGPAGKKFTGLLREAPYWQFLAPFVRTPVNIVKYGGARTPAAFLMPSVRAQLKQGGAARDNAMGRIIFGSGAMATIMYLVAQGVITGGGPTDPRERGVWLQKYQPYSMKINGEWHAYHRIEPLGFLFGIAADLFGAYNKLDEDDEEGKAQVTEAINIVYKSLVKNLASKTFLKGITDAISAYSDPDRYGSWWIKNIAGSAVPTISAHIASADDPYRRKAESILEKIQSRIPGQRQKLFPVRDIFGEPLPNGETWGPKMLSPIYTKVDKDDPVVNELLSLEVFPGTPQKKISGVKLSQQQYDRYAEMAGKLARQQLEQIINSPFYRDAPPFMQRDLLAKTFTETREIARLLLIKEYPNLFTESVRKKAKALERTRK